MGLDGISVIVKSGIKVNLLQTDICNQSHRKRVRLSMETYPETDVVICEIG